MAHIHWLGAGLSAGPGILRTLALGIPLTVWEQELARALHWVPANQARLYIESEFESALKPGDTIVSLLPAPLHPGIARIALRAGAHLVTSSYISEEMRSLHRDATGAGLSFVNECGLDPGLDHLIAHRLVESYRRQAQPGDRLEFYSICGGIPGHLRDPQDSFKYRFSWSPLGVLRALKNSCKFMDQGIEKTATRPWEAVERWKIEGEEFEVYPNRDSLSYLAEYGFDPLWKISTFMRGTLRLKGWKSAWSGLFGKIERASESELAVLSQELMALYSYQPDETDRVVLMVSLRSSSGFDETLILDHEGGSESSGQTTAMAQLVSLPASLAAEWVLAGHAPPGVSGAPHDEREILRWFRELETLGIRLQSSGTVSRLGV